MKLVEYHRWFITDEVTGKRRATRHHMKREDALATDPTAEPVPGSLEIRNLPESDAEHQHTSDWRA